MALQYKFLDRPKDVDACLKIMESTIVPLLKEHWDKHGKPVYQKDFNLNVEAFVTLWLGSGFAVVVAYDNDTPVGILIGLRVTPMNFVAHVLQVETCYGKTAEVEEGFYNYIESIRSVIGFDELWLNTDTNDEFKVKAFRAIGASSIVRFVKE